MRPDDAPRRHRGAATGRYRRAGLVAGGDPRLHAAVRVASAGGVPRPRGERGVVGDGTPGVGPRGRRPTARCLGGRAGRPVDRRRGGARASRRPAAAPGALRRAPGRRADRQCRRHAGPRARRRDGGRGRARLRVVPEPVAAGRRGRGVPGPGGAAQPAGRGLARGRPLRAGRGAPRAGRRTPRGGARRAAARHPPQRPRRSLRRTVRRHPPVPPGHARGACVTTEPPTVQRRHAEDEYAHELAALAKTDDRVRPPGWRMSPAAVVTYLLGGEAADGTPITPKYVGSRRLIEVAVATLTTDRALLLLGLPGTAKTWVSEHLAAAISGDSTLLVQGTAGTPEEAIRYGWNYARLLADGPSRAALVESPILRAMAEGRIARVEELTRMPSDIQDSLITVLSERTLPIPELGGEVQARKGFSLIATSNDRDRGVNELSSALRRRFNTVVLPVPAGAGEEGGRLARRAGGGGRGVQ